MHALNSTVAELRTQSTTAERRVRELEEQIEADDRAERLEENLKNTQNRADELEFQVSKLQQVHTPPIYLLLEYYALTRLNRSLRTLSRPSAIGLRPSYEPSLTQR